MFVWFSQSWFVSIIFRGFQTNSSSRQKEEKNVSQSKLLTREELKKSVSLAIKKKCSFIDDDFFPFATFLFSEEDTRRRSKEEEVVTKVTTKIIIVKCTYINAAIIVV